MSNAATASALANYYGANKSLAFEFADRLYELVRTSYEAKNGFSSGFFSETNFNFNVSVYTKSGNSRFSKQIWIEHLSKSDQLPAIIKIINQLQPAYMLCFYRPNLGAKKYLSTRDDFFFNEDMVFQLDDPRKMA